MKQYKLLKDLPGIPAGTVGRPILDDQVSFDGKSNHFYFRHNEMEQYPDFFHDMDTPEPETRNVQEQFVNPPCSNEHSGPEPTIGELLAIREHFGYHSESKNFDISETAKKMIIARLGINSEPKKEGI